jgi:hypothetical protein
MILFTWSLYRRIHGIACQDAIVPQLVSHGAFGPLITLRQARSKSRPNEERTTQNGEGTKTAWHDQSYHCCKRSDPYLGAEGLL